MISDNTPYHEQFHKLLDQVRDEVDSLKDEIKDLEKENDQLRSKLKEIKEGQTDIYSEISESERLTLRHQVIGLISKIDDHLEDSS